MYEEHKICIKLHVPYIFKQACQNIRKEEMQFKANKQLKRKTASRAFQRPTTRED